MIDFDSSPAPELLPMKAPAAELAKVEPCEIRARVENTDLVPAEARTKAQERLNFCQMVLEKMRHTGKPMREACEIIALNFAESFPLLLNGGKGGSSQLTYNNCRHWLSLLGKNPDGNYNFANSAALCDNYKRGAQFENRKGDEKFWQYFFSLYLNKNRLPATQAYKLAVTKLRKENPFAIVPTRQQATYRIGQLDPAAVLLARNGEEALKNSFIDYIRRDWTDVQPGMVMVSDSRDFDFFIKAWDEEKQAWKAVRPKICGMIDARSWYITSWQITIEAINCATITDALALHIVRNNGHIPGFLYVDNGKDFTASGFSEPVKFDGYEHSIFKELGIHMVNSLPYNGRAKTIERLFRDVMQQFDKLFASYVGSRPGERPDTAQFFADNPEKLPSLEQLCQIFAAWIKEYHATPKRGEIHRGQSPEQIWEGRIQQREPLSNDRLFMAFLRPEAALRTVHRGPAISLDKVEYYAQELWTYLDKKVMLKTDRNDPEHIYAFTVDGALICECRTRAKVKALDFSEENRGMIAEGMSRQRQQIRKAYTAIEQLTGGYNVLSPIALMAMPPDAKIVKDGERTSVKGAAHKFVHYIVEGSGQVAELPSGEGNESENGRIGESAREEERQKIDFKEDRQEAKMQEFQNAVFKNESENRRTGESETASLADFHKFIVSKKKEEE